MAKPFKTGRAIATALGISPQRLGQLCRAYGWPGPPWTPSLLAAKRAELEGLRAAAPNPGSHSGDDATTFLFVKGKLKFLAEKIRRLEMENQTRAGTLVPREQIAEARLQVIQAFKGMFDAIESRAYELAALNEPEILAVIRRWRDEFYRTIRLDSATISPQASPAAPD